MRVVLKRLSLALAASAALAACSDPAPFVEPPAQYITVRRAWLPGERAALLAEIAANHSLNFLYVGDLSDLAPQIYADTDSVVVMVPTPLFTGSQAFGGALTSPSLLAGPQFSATWTFIGARITTIDTSRTPPDTIFWHSVLWRDPANAGNHGFVLGFNRATNFNISQINSTTFDANLGKLGAGAGEFHAGTATLWSDVGSGGNFQVTSEVFPGAYSTITTGPYLGGQSRAGTIYGRVFNSTFTRVTGTENPATFTVSFDYRGTGLPATDVFCLFPSPCTTNVAGLMGLRAR